MASSDLVIVSNRGPLSFSHDDGGGLVARRGAGGLVSSLGPAVAGAGATWVAAAISAADRDAASRGVVEAEGFRLRSLVVDPDAYRAFYEVVANATLWFLNHSLWDLPRRPRFDRHWYAAWDAYRDVNDAFAGLVAAEAPEGATVLVQDYHLSLVPSLLRKRRTDVRIVHFTHTPFCEPLALRVLPAAVRHELIEGMTASLACGFHSPRWAEAFRASARSTTGEEPRTFVAPAAPDIEDMLRVAAGDRCRAAARALEEATAGRRLIVRVDRIELSKNIVRGFHAFEELLRSHPQWRERVVFLASVYPSRESLPEYLAYRQEVEGVAARINATWATTSWTPIVLDTSDDFPASVAALTRYDVLLVNPVRDGLNLVAKEGPLVNERNGVLVLSEEAGVWEEVGEHAIGVNPFDILGTAEALVAALELPEAEREGRAAALREAAQRRTPQHWLDDQVRAAQAG